MNDPLAPARGVLLGLAISAGFWLTLYFTLSIIF